jgi:putative aldouronate transport system permease protein
VGSFNEGTDYLRGGVYFWPRKFTLENYRTVFIDTSIIHAAYITVLRTVIGTVSHVLFTLLAAYAMSRRELKFRNIYSAIFIVSMFFGGGLIPTYLLYRSLHLLDTFWVYIIPGLFSVWDMIIFRAFIKGIPESIIESARIDGAGEYYIFLRLIIPLSLPAMAAIALFTGVGHWNSWFDAMIFTNRTDLQTLQYYLYKIISNYNYAAGIGVTAEQQLPSQVMNVQPETLRLAMMIVTTGPIILLYPWLQKYFIKGVYIGSLKD